MAIYDKFVVGANVNEYRAVGCQLNVPLTSGSFADFQAVRNSFFNETAASGYAANHSGIYTHTGTTSWERPGSDLTS